MDKNNLIFEPLRETSCFGNITQLSRTRYKGVNIYETVYWPWNIFKDTVYRYRVDRIVKVGKDIPGATVNIDLYTEDGFGFPEFSELEGAIEYINNIKK